MLGSQIKLTIILCPNLGTKEANNSTLVHPVMVKESILLRVNPLNSIEAFWVNQIKALINNSRGIAIHNVLKQLP